MGAYRRGQNRQSRLGATARGGLDVLERDFEDFSLIGSGDYGAVYRCVNKVDGWAYAVKKTKRKPRSLGELQRSILTEAYAYAALGSHPNLVRYFRSWVSTDGVLFLQVR